MRIALSVAEKEKTKGPESPYYQALMVVGVKANEIEVVAASDAGRVHVEDFDGILFTGGEDVNPSLYGEVKRHESVHSHPARDEFEFSLLDHALTRRLPILGICRGTQMINVKFGGTLYQDMDLEACATIGASANGPRLVSTSADAHSAGNRPGVESRGDGPGDLPRQQPASPSRQAPGARVKSNRTL